MRPTSRISEYLAAFFAFGFAISVCVFVGAVTANAQTISTTPAKVMSSAPACLSITHTLTIGSQGKDVTELQTYLAKDSSLYPEGLVTGYYGSLTAHAVEHFQAAHGIVSSGTSATTGYGAVGPRTREALSMCRIDGPIEPKPPVVTNPDATAMITTADNNGTVVVTKGQHVAVQLGDSMNWLLNFEPDTILTRVKNIMVTRGEQGLYTATDVGTTTLSATGSPICNANEACPMYLMVMKTTIVVR